MARPGIFRHPPEPQKQPPFDIGALPFAQAIKPAAKIATSFHAFTPNIVGGSQRLFPAAKIASSFAAFFPTLVGGGGGMVCYIGGVLFPMLVDGASDPLPGGAGNAAPVTIDSQTLGRWTAKFDVYDDAGTYVPAVGQTVVLIENGTRLFMGCIQDVVAELLTGSSRIVYHVTGVDKSSILDHRILNVSYASGTQVVDAVKDIINTKLAGEGFTLYSLAASITTLDQDENFFFVTARQALDKLATDCSCIWWVDIAGELHFVPYASLATCPFSITTATSSKWHGLTLRSTLLDYRNKQYAVSNLQPLPSQTAGGAAAAAITETYTLPEAASVAAGFIFGSLITNFPILQITSFTVNGVSQDVLLGTSGYNFRHAWWFFPASPYVTAPSTANDVPAFPAPPNPSPDPVAGDVVVISYIPSLPASAPANLGVPTAGIATGSALTATGGTCGTGVYEAVEQVKNVNLVADLQAIADAVLARSGGTPPKYVTFITQMPGAQVGMILPVVVPLLGLSGSDTFVITAIQGSHQGGQLGDGTGFFWRITAQTGQDKGNQTKWFERLVARTENALPILQNDSLKFVLSPGSSLSAGVNVANNPSVVERSGKILEVYGAAGVAPTGQDLLIDILADGVSIFPAGGMLKIPAGSTALQKVDSFAVNYLYRDQILTVNATYSVLSGSVAAASGVTVGLRLSI